MWPTSSTVRGSAAGRTVPFFNNYLGNQLISFLFNLLYNQMLSDMEVCYRMFTPEVLNQLNRTSNDFGVEIEISAQIGRAKRWRIGVKALMRAWLLPPRMGIVSPGRSHCR
jgi:hypothetical protein